MCSTSRASRFRLVATTVVSALPCLCAVAGTSASAHEDAQSAAALAMGTSAIRVQATDGQSRFEALARRCAPGVEARLLGRVATVESGGNPYAIGVVGGHLTHQPKSLREALDTAAELDAGGWNYSLGLVQVNVHNLAMYGQTPQGVFDPCTNLKTGASILRACYERAVPHSADVDAAVYAALSCYYSGNFVGGAAYARKVAASRPVTALATQHSAIPVVPDIRPGATTAGAPNSAVSLGAKPARTRPDTARAATSRLGDDWFTTWGDTGGADTGNEAGISRPDPDSVRETQ